MAMTDAKVSASASASLRGVFPPQGVASTLSDVDSTQSVSGQMTALTYGTATGKVDLVTVSHRTLTAAGGATPTATYDLYTGTDLADLIGDACPFRKVRFVMVSIISGGDASGLRIGGAAANAWPAFFADATDKHLIFPSGPPYLAGSPAGVAVGATTKNLLIENLGAAAITYAIAVAGTSS